MRVFERENKNLLSTTESRHVLLYAAENFDDGNEMIDRLGDISQKGGIRIQSGISRHVPRSAVDATLKFIIGIGPGVCISLHEDGAGSLKDPNLLEPYYFSITCFKP